jgi:hypothetical protein
MLTRLLSPFRMLLLLYSLALLLALPATYGLLSGLQSAAGGSVAPLEMLAGFNYTVFSDFMHRHSESVWLPMRVGWLSSLLFVLVWTWATGGILYSLSAPYRAEKFWQVGTYYAGRYARLLGLTALFTAAVFLVPFLMGILLAVLLESKLTERGLFWLGFGGFALGTLGTLLVWCIAAYTKVWIFRHDEPNVFRAFGRAGRFVLTNLRRTLGTYLLLVALGAGLLGTYLLADALILSHNWLTIGLLFVVQQVVIFGRIVLNVHILRVATTQLVPVAAPLRPATAAHDVPASGDVPDSGPALVQ